MATSGLARHLIQEGLLSSADYQLIASDHSNTGAAFAKVVVALGILDETKLAYFLANKTRLPLLPPGSLCRMSADVEGLLPLPLLQTLEVVPISLKGRYLSVAMADPLDHHTIEQLSFFTSYKIKPTIATLSSLHKSLRTLIHGFTPQTTILQKFLSHHQGASSRFLPLRASPSPANEKKQRPQKASTSLAPKSKLFTRAEVETASELASKPGPEDEMPLEISSPADDGKDALAFGEAEEAADLNWDEALEAAAPQASNDWQEQKPSVETGAEFAAQQLEQEDAFSDEADEASVLEPQLEASLDEDSPTANLPAAAQSLEHKLFSEEDPLFELDESDFQSQTASGGQGELDSPLQASAAAENAQPQLQTQLALAAEDWLEDEQELATSLKTMGHASEVAFDELSQELDSLDATSSLDFGPELADALPEPVSAEQTTFPRVRPATPFAPTLAISFLNHAIAATSLAFNGEQARQAAQEGLIKAGIPRGVILAYSEQAARFLTHWSEEEEEEDAKFWREASKHIDPLQLPADPQDGLCWQKVSSLPPQLETLQAEGYYVMAHWAHFSSKQKGLTLASWRADCGDNPHQQNVAARLVSQLGKKYLDAPKA